MKLKPSAGSQNFVFLLTASWVGFALFLPTLFSILLIAIPLFFGRVLKSESKSFFFSFALLIIFELSYFLLAGLKFNLYDTFYLFKHFWVALSVYAAGVLLVHHTQQNQRAITRILLLIAFTFSIYALLSVLKSSWTYSLWDHYDGDLFFSFWPFIKKSIPTTHWGIFLSIGGCLGTLLLLPQSLLGSKKFSVFLFLHTLLILVGFQLSKGRGPFLTLTLCFAAVSAFLFSQKAFRLRNIKPFAFLFGAAFIVFEVLMSVFPHFVRNRFTDAHLGSGRFSLWRKITENAFEYPWGGKAYPIFEYENTTLQAKTTYGHNIFFDTLYDVGIIPCLALAGFYLLHAVYLSRILKQETVSKLNTVLFILFLTLSILSGYEPIHLGTERAFFFLVFIMGIIYKKSTLISKVGREK